MTEEKTETIPNFFQRIFVETRSRVHERADIIFHLRSEGIVATLHVQGTKHEDTVYQPHMISWADLTGAKADILERLVLEKLVESMKLGIGKHLYYRAAKDGEIENAVEWDELPTSMKIRWAARSQEL